MLRRPCCLLPILAFTLTGSALAQASGSLTIDNFFDSRRVQEIRVTMNPADWASLKKNYNENTDYPCDMESRGLVVKNAAIHSAGVGSRNPIKPRLTIDFNEFASSQQFLGMKSLVLRNSQGDPSMLHEPLSMAMFARMGLPYSRETHAKLYVNGDYAGLYLMVEPVDTRFLTSRFGESGGYLFKYYNRLDNYHWTYLGDDPALYVPSRFEPKTHEKNPDPQWIADLIKVINFSPDAEFATNIRKYIDMDTFMAHTAVEQFLAEWDGILGEVGTANFYLYRRKADDRGVFLVWDKEITFSEADRSIWRNTDRNVLMRRALNVPEFRRHYLETLAEAARVAGGPNGWLETEAARLTEQIRQEVLEDPVKTCAAQGGSVGLCPNEVVEANFRWVALFARERQQRVEAELREAGFELPANALRPGAAAALTTAIARLAPGGLAQMELPPADRVEARAAGFPLPRELAGVTVWIGNLRAPLISLQASGVILQVPLELAPGPQRLELTGNGVPGNSITVDVRPAVPVLFMAVHPDGNLVESNRPATPGEWITLYGTGLGAAARDFPSGESAPQDPPLRIHGAVKAKIGGKTAKVIWAGFTPGFAGLQQILLEVPADVEGRVRIDLTMFEEVGQPFEIPVR